MPKPFVSVIIPTWNGRSLLGPCLDSLRTQTYSSTEIVVVDGGSADGTTELIQSAYPGVQLLALPRNLGFTGNVNAGIRRAAGDIICLLNNDATVDSTWIEALAECLDSDVSVGSCASKMLNHKGDRIDSAGDCLGRDGLAWQRGAGERDRGQYDQIGPVFSACGGAVAYRRAMLDDVGLLDEGYRSYLEDVDLGLRAQLRGWRCLYVPDARVYHRGSATGGGPLASFHVARNSIRLIARGFPTHVFRACLGRMIAAQARRGLDAARAWRGEAARATLRGIAAGIVNLPDALQTRRAIQRRRTISDVEFLKLLS